MTREVREAEVRPGPMAPVQKGARFLLRDLIAAASGIQSALKLRMTAAMKGGAERKQELQAIADEYLDNRFKLLQNFYVNFSCNTRYKNNIVCQ